MNNRFHACATCIHYGVTKTVTGQQFRCTRLGYETKPFYKFNCWIPKEQVKKLMEKERGEKEKRI
jgi:hypothetical protein